jgi:hypothetical protein
MNRRTTVLLLVILCVGATMCFAADPNLGTWKLNEAKSKAIPGSVKNSTVVYTASGDSIKGTIDGTDGKGNPMHSEWVGKFDGKDYPVTGDPSSDTRAMKKINDRTLDITVKKDGKVTITGQIVVAADGKSRTLTAHATDASGKMVEGVSVYDKQ